MRYFVYIITNILNNKKYIGAHRCKCDFLESDYWGSGVAISQAILDEGIQNFTRSVLVECASEHEMYEEERRRVHIGVVRSKNYYNIVLGGRNGLEETKRDVWKVKHSKLEGRKDAKKKMIQRAKAQMNANANDQRLLKFREKMKIFNDTHGAK